MVSVRYLVLMGLFLSCGLFPKEEPTTSKAISVPTYKKKYKFVDKAGKFFIYREAGRSRADKNYVVKKKNVLSWEG